MRVFGLFQEWLPGGTVRDSLYECDAIETRPKLCTLGVGRFTLRLKYWQYLKRSIFSSVVFVSNKISD